MAPDQPGDGDQPREENPLAQFLSQFGITPGPDGEFDMAALTDRLQSVMAQFQSQLASMGPTDADSGMNWTFTKDIARKVTASQGPDLTPSAAQAGQVRDAAGLADLWLDEEIAFARLSAPALAWSRAEWIEGTFPVWRRLANPIVTSLSAALGELMAREAGPG